MSPRHENVQAACHAQLPKQMKAEINLLKTHHRSVRHISCSLDGRDPRSSRLSSRQVQPWPAQRAPTPSMPTSWFESKVGADRDGKIEVNGGEGSGDPLVCWEARKYCRVTHQPPKCSNATFGPRLSVSPRVVKLSNLCRVEDLHFRSFHLPAEEHQKVEMKVLFVNLELGSALVFWGLAFY